MLVGRRHREGEVEIQKGEGMIAVEEVAGVGSRAQVEGLALNSIGKESRGGGDSGAGEYKGIERIGERNASRKFKAINGDSWTRTWMLELRGSKYFWLGVREGFL